MGQSEIVKKGIELTAPLNLTWSCYERNDMACGRCHSCTLRMNAFADAGVENKIPYV